MTDHSIAKPQQPVPVCPRSGQAAIEFVACLLLLLLVIAGTIHVNRMARTSLFLHSVLRGLSGKEAMESGSASVAPTYISDWQAGTDGDRYTADDTAVRNGAALPSILGTLTRLSVKEESDWSAVVDKSVLPVSMATLQHSPVASTVLGFVHREETLHVPVGTVIRQLVYDKDKVAIKEEVWMPLMGGLY